MTSLPGAERRRSAVWPFPPESVSLASVSDHPRPPAHTHCENCGTPLTGPFCAHCGQRDLDLNRSLRHLGHEVLESFLHFDAKWFRGLVDLLFRPGFLTTEYIAGRRTRHIPPFRLYLFTSLVYFFLAFTFAQKIPPLFRADPPAAAAAAIKEAAAQKKSRSTTAPGAAKSGFDVSRAKADSPPGAVKFSFDGKENGPLMRLLNDRLGTEEARGHFSEALLHRAPQIIIVCLPIFALLSAWFFRRPGLYFFAHLVFSLHLHTFYYLWTMFIDGWSGLLDTAFPGLGGLLRFAGVLYFLSYLFRTFRAVFGRSRWATLWRGSLLFLCYGFAMIFVFFGALAVTVWLG